MRTMIKLIGLMVLAMCELGGMPLACACAELSSEIHHGGCAIPGRRSE